MIIIDGKTLKQNILEAMARHNSTLSYSTIYFRVRFHNWNIEKAVTTPPDFERKERIRQRELEKEIMIDLLKYYKCSSCFIHERLCYAGMKIENGQMVYRCSKCQNPVKIISRINKKFIEQDLIKISA